MAAHTAAVTGDITIDWMLAQPRDPAAAPPHWTNERNAAVFRQAGGAALLAELIRRDAASLGSDAPTWAVRAPKLTTESLHSDTIPADNPDHDHAFSIWQPVPVHDESDKHRTNWRVSEFQGWNNRMTPNHDHLKIEDDDPDADVVVLIDAGLGFRSARQVWPAALTDADANPKWLILRLTYSRPEGELWEHLVDKWASRLVVITSVRDLRHMHAQISKQLSWERTAQDATLELQDNTNNRHLCELRKCAWIAVSMGRSGALLVPGKPRNFGAGHLVFDPRTMEGEWERPLKGHSLGSSTSFTAALVHQVLADPDTTDLTPGLSLGIRAQRRLHEVGYSKGPKTLDAGTMLPAKLDFPFEDIVAVLNGKGRGQASLRTCHLADVSIETQEGAEKWTILEEKYKADRLDALAKSIVVNGVASSLAGVPVLEFNELVTVDRDEIEAVRSIERLIAEYCHRDAYCRDNERSPLCIAVFGPPGSGKSFAVKQVAKHALPGRVESIEFNLSQFERPHDLFDALHRVRDVNLAGQIPLVVWDEFDTSLDEVALGWLRYFLQPMQDGTFQQGEITHPIGQCIFVFAGGTASRMTEFPTELDESEQRTAKVRDFVSRLHGYMDVLGPNRQPREPNGPELAGDDPYYIVRRAVILRGILESDDLSLTHGDEVAIDPGVLHAFLNARKYKHGVRSMKSIVGMSLLAGAKVFEISSLPPTEQLALHVTEDFLDLARRHEAVPV